jgi:hypothetical protein
MRPDMLARVHPADRAVFLILLAAVGVCLLRLPAPGRDVVPLLAVHLSLAAAYAAYLGLAAMRESRWVSHLLRPAVNVGVVFTLYSTLGRLGLVAMPHADAALSWVDTHLLAMPPLALERVQTAHLGEAFAVPYALFIPYIYLSAVLGTFGRPPVERDAFLTGWMLTYATSYLGYLFLPAEGPIAFHAAGYAGPLQGGQIYDLVQRGVAATGGNFGAFPSLHVGSSLYLCVFDLRTNRLRGLTYLPVVVSIYAATVVLRFHYVIDLVVGTFVALACVRVGPACLYRWMRVRVARGLTPLPGEDPHAVLGLPPAGDDRAPGVLPADRG